MNKQGDKTMKKLYFAGGWFNPKQEEEHTRIGNFLESLKKFDIFNPRTAGGDFNAGLETDHMTQVLMNNINAIQESDIVLAITDYKDMGTLWECGFAYANNKPIIYYCETLGNKPFNLMLAKTGRVAKDVDDLIELLKDEQSFVFSKTHSYKGVIE